MIPDFKKSIDDILYERISSPFFGALLFSWCIWNWRIIYLTIFISADKIKDNKIDFIVNNYADNLHLIVGPLVSTLFLILVYPFIAAGAFWVSLKFDGLKNNMRNSAEKRLLLSVEQSIALREAIRNQDDKFDKLLTKKDEEITILKAEIQSYRSQLNIGSEQKQLTNPNNDSNNAWEKEYKVLRDNSRLLKQFSEIAPRAQKTVHMFPAGNTLDRSLFNYFLVNDIIQVISSSAEQYSLTSKGRYFQKKLVNESVLGVS